MRKIHVSDSAPSGGGGGSGKLGSAESLTGLCGGGSGGKGKGADGSMGSEVAGNGGGGGGGGRVDGPASHSDMEDEAPALDEEGSGILGPAWQPRNETEEKLVMITKL